MMENVIKFYPKDAAKDPDVVLEKAIGEYEQVFIIGYDKDGQIDARGSMNFSLREIFFVLDHFKFKVFNGDYGDRLTDGKEDA